MFCLGESANAAGWALQFQKLKAKTPCKLRRLGLHNRLPPIFREKKQHMLLLRIEALYALEFGEQCLFEVWTLGRSSFTTTRKEVKTSYIIALPCKPTRVWTSWISYFNNNKAAR